MFVTDNGWKHSWGGVDVGNGQLFLKATTTSTGALAFLDGSSDWKNYGYSVVTSPGPDSFVFLIARYRDDQNYASCWFSDTQVKIAQKINGFTTTLLSGKNHITSAGSMPSYGIEAENNTIRCFIDRREVASTTISPALGRGGIGVGTWQSQENDATASIFSLEAHDL